MTVSAKVRKSLPASRLGKPKTGGYPMQDKKHAAIAKGFAAMHNDPDKAEIDAKANAILAKKRGGLVTSGKGKKPHLGRIGRQTGGSTMPSWTGPGSGAPGSSPIPTPSWTGPGSTGGGVPAPSYAAGSPAAQAAAGKPPAPPAPWAPGGSGPLPWDTGGSAMTSPAPQQQAYNPASGIDANYWSNLATQALGAASNPQNPVYQQMQNSLNETGGGNWQSLLGMGGGGMGANTAQGQGLLAQGTMGNSMQSPQAGGRSGSGTFATGGRVGKGRK